MLIYLIAIVFVCVIGLRLSINASAEGDLVPSWIKSTVGFWIEGQVSDGEFYKPDPLLVSMQ